MRKVSMTWMTPHDLAFGQRGLDCFYAVVAAEGSSEFALMQTQTGGESVFDVVKMSWY
jgi:hypothetical protein